MKGVRGQNISPGLEPWSDFRNPAACGRRAARRHDRELPWVGRDPLVDQTFLRHMSIHHDQGILLVSIAAEKASDPHLRALSKLMVASQRGEAKIFVHWRASWFDEPMQICSAAERASMPGLLDTANVAKLGSAEALSFDQLFVDL